MRSTLSTRVLLILLLTGAVLASGCNGHKAPVRTQADATALLKLKGKRVALLGYTVVGPKPLLSELGDLSRQALHQELTELFVLVAPEDDWRTIELSDSLETKEILTSFERTRAAREIAEMQAEAGILAADVYGYLGSSGIVSQWQVITSFMLLDKDGNTIWQLRGRLLRDNTNPFTRDKLRELVAAVFFNPPPLDIVRRSLGAVVAGRWKLTRRVLLEDMAGETHSAARSYLPEWGKGSWFLGLEKD